MSDKDAMEKAASECAAIREEQLCAGGGYSDRRTNYIYRDTESVFKEAWRAALDGPAVDDLVHALKTYGSFTWVHVDRIGGKQSIDIGVIARNALAEFEKLREASK